MYMGTQLASPNCAYSLCAINNDKFSMAEVSTKMVGQYPTPTPSTNPSTPAKHPHKNHHILHNPLALPPQPNNKQNIPNTLYTDLDVCTHNY